MHVRELVELGALVATHGSLLMQRCSVLTERHMQQYWLASCYRRERWSNAMKRFREGSSIDARDNWYALRPALEEILASELLTRIWAAVACTHDQTHQTDVLAPVARSVLVGHLEARNRALHLMVHGQGTVVEDGVILNRLRRQTERWTDMLLGYLVKDHDVTEFAFDTQRARDFAADVRHESRYAPGDHTWKLALASLRAAFQSTLSEVSPNGDLNERIAGSIMACFHSDLFDSSGMLKSRWMLRIGQIADDTQGLVDDLLQLDELPRGRFSLRGRV